MARGSPPSTLREQVTSTHLSHFTSNIHHSMLLPFRKIAWFVFEGSHYFRSDAMGAIRLSFTTLGYFGDLAHPVAAFPAPLASLGSRPAARLGGSGREWEPVEASRADMYRRRFSFRFLALIYSC